MKNEIPMYQELIFVIFLNEGFFIILFFSFYYFTGLLSWLLLDGILI